MSDKLCAYTGRMDCHCMKNLCEICGEPMPEGEEMFMYHGYSGPCPKPPKQTAVETEVKKGRGEGDRR